MENKFVDKICQIDGEECVNDINDKYKAISILETNPRVSLVDRDFNLIVLSPSEQAVLQSFSQIEDQPKCHKLYRNFNKMCDWCKLPTVLSTGKFDIMTEVSTPWKSPGSQISHLTSANIHIFPCGIQDIRGYSHGLLWIRTTTKNSRTSLHARRHIHRVQRLLFEAVQQTASEDTLLSVLLFGCLFASGPHVSKCHLYLLQSQKIASGYAAKYTIDRCAESEHLWESIIKKGISNISDIANSSCIKRTNDVKGPNISDKDRGAMLDGEPRVIEECRQAITFVGNLSSTKMPGFFLVIDKTHTEDIISFSEIGALSSYGTFSRHTVRNRFWHSRFLYISDFYKLHRHFLLENKESYGASLLVSRGHNAGAAWNSVETGINSMLTRIENSPLRNDPIILSAKESLNAGVESLSDYYYFLQRWRKQSSVKLVPVNIVDIINSAHAFFTIRFKAKRVSFSFAQSTQNIFCMADETYLFDIFNNLFKNSLDAIENTKPPRITVNINSDNSEYVKITVSDNGPGFDSKDWIFLPGNTTKDTGTGYGLPFIKYVVEVLFKGSVDGYCINGKSGANFVITLKKD